ncbi:MAG: DEAD/DEAH box helicase [Clostridia bacterium]|nr:DEAD/DEAH box helicase [Clostridia bacterium]
MKLHIIVDSMIRIKYPPEFQAWGWSGLLRDLERDMVIPNPAYAEALRRRGNAWSIPKTLELWNRSPGQISLPRGYGRQLVQLLRQHCVPWQREDRRVQLESVDFGSRIRLRNYQAPAVERMVEATGGVLEAPAGCGKTQMGLEIISRLEQPALWITHTKDLAAQVRARAVEVLNLDATEIGLIGAGQRNVGPRLTIGIIQSLSKMDLRSIADRFGTVLLDECHHSPAETWIGVLNQIPARYRYGVTATLSRQDGLEIITERALGPTIYSINRTQISLEGGLITPQLFKVDTGAESEAWKQHENKVEKHKIKAQKLEAKGKKAPRTPVINFGELISDVLANEARNRLIAETVAENAVGHFSLVLSARIEHCEVLQALLADIAPELRTKVIHGNTKAEHRSEHLAAMAAGDLDVLLAVKIAEEGLDLPRLDRLHLVAGGRDPKQVEQKVGRIQRPAPGKVDAVVFDYVDEKIPPFRGQYYARRKVYRELGMLELRGQQSAGM